MPIHASGIVGTPGRLAQATYVNEVFVNDLGVYVGDFSQKVSDYTNTLAASSETYLGETTPSEQDMPLGWAHAVTGSTTGFISGFALFAQGYWDDCSNPDRSADAVYETLNAFFPLAGPTFMGTVLADTSGPPGFGSANACRVDGAGAPGSFSWVGHDASLVPGASPYSGGWNPTHGQQWTFSGWFRAVPDSNGFICSGYTCGFGFAQFGHPPLGAGSFIVTETWQFFTVTFNWPYSTGPGIPSFQLQDSRFSNPVTKTIVIPPFAGTFTITKNDLKGSVEMKELHLYTSLRSTPRHIAQRF